MGAKGVEHFAQPQLDVPSSENAPSSKALVPTSFLFLVVRHLLLVAMHLFLVPGDIATS